MVRKSVLLIFAFIGMSWADAGFKDTIQFTETDGSPKCMAGQVKVTAGTLTCSGQTATISTARATSQNVYLSTTAAVGFDEYLNGTYTAISTITWNNGNHQSVTLTANTTFSFTAPSCPSGSSSCEVPVSLRIATGAGSFTTAWPGSVLWKAGTAPTTTATASKVDYVVCRYANATGKYYCDGTSQNF